MNFSDDSWGGGIELAILTQEYEIEICVINTECGGRIDYFGEDRHFPYRVFLLYNNLHYDPGKRKTLSQNSKIIVNTKI
jgi:ubiquitin thioesterase OTU1